MLRDETYSRLTVGFCFPPHVANGIIILKTVSCVEGVVSQLCQSFKRQNIQSPVVATDTLS